jgi:hypothetical protein
VDLHIKYLNLIEEIIKDIRAQDTGESGNWLKREERSNTI